MSLNTQKQKTVLKLIAVSEENYLILKGLGGTGDSFNDVVTEVLKQLECDNKIHYMTLRGLKPKRAQITSETKAPESGPAHG
jgi:hypothetical protein